MNMVLILDCKKLDAAGIPLVDCGDRVTLKQLMEKLNLSRMATWKRFEHLRDRGLARVIYE